MKPLSTKNYVDSEGIKVLVYGDSGVGKTYLISTLTKPFLISVEKRVLSLHLFDVPYLAVESVDDFNKTLTWALSQSQYETIVIDSLSELAELMVIKQKPLFKDPRQAYGKVQEDIIALIRFLRNVKQNVYMIAKEDRISDAEGNLFYGPMITGSKLPQLLPYLLDEYFRLVVQKDFQTKKLARQLQCVGNSTSKAKDSSGNLSEYEPADLTYIFSKIKGK